MLVMPQFLPHIPPKDVGEDFGEFRFPPKDVGEDEFRFHIPPKDIGEDEFRFSLTRRVAWRGESFSLARSVGKTLASLEKNEVTKASITELEFLMPSSG